jgi:hypothetical protein
MPINSELQLVACDIAEFVGEPDKVGFWIGQVKKIGKQRAYQILSEMKQKESGELFLPPERRKPIKSRAAYFIWKAKNG